MKLKRIAALILVLLFIPCTAPAVYAKTDLSEKFGALLQTENESYLKDVTVGEIVPCVHTNDMADKDADFASLCRNANYRMAVLMKDGVTTGWAFFAQNSCGRWTLEDHSRADTYLQQQI